MDGSGLHGGGKLLTRLSDEKGVSGILIGASLFLMMGVAAIALDISAGFNERRQDQTSADAGALAAGVALMSGGGDVQAVAAAKQLVTTNLSSTVSAADWLACTDSDALGSYSSAQATALGLPQNQPCISFGSSGNGLAFDRIRVKVPTRDTSVVFGRVLGAINIQTSAAAEVTLEPVGQSGSFPASVYNSAAAGNTFCIKTGTNGNAQNSCGGSTQGNFGSFRPYIYVEVGPSNPNSVCDTGESSHPMSYVMANGIDHLFGIATGEGSGVRTNGADCPVASGGSVGPLFPDRVRETGGYQAADVTRGLVTSGTYDGVPYIGRLQHARVASAWADIYGSATVFGIRIDNRPLWTFIDATQAGLADAAIPGNATDCTDAAALPANPTPVANPYAPATDAVDAAYALLFKCLTDFASFNVALADGLFVEEIYRSSRLTVVPEYWQFGPSGNFYDIKDFRPAYINSIWTEKKPQWQCTGTFVMVSGSYCRHEPGRTGEITVQGNATVDSANAILLNCEMLPSLDDPRERCKRISTPGGNTITAYLNIFLTK